MTDNTKDLERERDECVAGIKQLQAENARLAAELKQVLGSPSQMQSPDMDAQAQAVKNVREAWAESERIEKERDKVRLCASRQREMLDSTLAQLYATQEDRDKEKEKCGALAESVLDNWREVKKAKADQNLYEQAYNNGLIEGRYRQTIKMTEAGQEAYEKGIGPKAVAERWKAVALAILPSKNHNDIYLKEAILDGNINDAERLLGIGESERKKP